MSNPIRVLILEDRAADVELMLHELRQAGLDPHFQCVENEPDYLAALEIEPDLILADWSLPQFNGLRALHLMNERGLDIPFIIVSASIGEEEAVQAMREGADDYLLKDRLARLGEAVHRALDNKQLQEGRKKAEEALRASEEKHWALIEQSLDGIVISDQHGKVTVWNKSMESITGIQQRETIGRPLWEVQFRLVPDGKKTPELLEQLQNNLKNILESKMEWPGESREQEIMHVNGTHKVVQDSYFITKTNNNVNIGSIIRDITERKQNEKELKAYSEHLEDMVEERTRELREVQEQLVLKEKLAVLGQLAGGVGHELRNPLGVINNAIYYLKMVQPDADDEVQQYHVMIEQEVHNSEKIINDLLDFARGNSADQESVSVLELVQSVLIRFPAPPSVEVVLKISADLPRIFADPRQLEKVLGNLTTNAYQAMANGGKLTITAHTQKELMAIAVDDTGTGITPENMKKLFEPLFTTKCKGIGLGLAVSKKMVEANGGRIEVQSKVGKGSTFTLFLPFESIE